LARKTLQGGYEFLMTAPGFGEGGSRTVSVFPEAIQFKEETLNYRGIRIPRQKIVDFC